MKTLKTSLLILLCLSFLIEPLAQALRKNLCSKPLLLQTSFKAAAPELIRKPVNQ